MRSMTFTWSAGEGEREPAECELGPALPSGCISGAAADAPACGSCGCSPVGAAAGAAGFFQDSALAAGQLASRRRPSGASGPGGAAEKVRGAPPLGSERSLPGLATTSGRVAAPVPPRGPVAQQGGCSLRAALHEDSWQAPSK